ncbi:MAG TPA: serine/threonine-protein kinase [Gemmatimonadales bacterium]|jgi:serine/threonine-protein kinase|nr:serine/threonine-protein kinase [Gemmatimonadales bacterium]
MIERLRAALADRYELEREIGQGGMAVVFLARDLKHHRPVALKVLRPELTASLGAERFLREIDTAAGLNHPHILPLHDSGEAAGCLYYVMPYVEGESLRDRLSREKRLPLEEALLIGREVADALSYAHSQGIVHRDIKPENILLAAGHAVVSDFGIARAMEAAGAERLTGTGLALGTPAYMSPEQATGESRLDARSDIYSLGCVIYETLSGEPPFAGPTVHAVLAKRLTEAAPGVRRLRAEVPVPVEQAIARALAREPAERFDSAAGLALALTTGPTAAVSRVTRPLTGWRRMAAFGAAAVVLTAIGVAIVRRFTAPAGRISPTAVAVLPFSVHGLAAAAYLGEGMVDLLSRNLDGAGDLRSIDAGTVLTAARGTARSGGAVDTQSGRATARRVGAGLYVLGSVYGVAGRLRIQAAMYGGGDASDTAGSGSAAVSQATVEGDTTEVLQLVDRLSADLLANRRRGPAFRLTETAARTSRSLPALKVYLDAERDLRLGKLDSAVAGFQRAVGEDSSFALAHYRLAVAAGWAGRAGLSDAAIERALEYGKRLGERDRRLLTAYAGFRRGAADQAEGEYRAALTEFPDDLEAEFQLANLLNLYNPLRGRPRSEARELYDRVLAVDPGFG